MTKHGRYMVNNVKGDPSPSLWIQFGDTKKVLSRQVQECTGAQRLDANHPGLARKDRQLACPEADLAYRGKRNSPIIVRVAYRDQTLCKSPKPSGLIAAVIDNLVFWKPAQHRMGQHFFTESAGRSGEPTLCLQDFSGFT
jgi:hypothetical protein